MILALLVSNIRAAPRIGHWFSPRGGAPYWYRFFFRVLAQVYGTAGRREEGLNRLIEATKSIATTQGHWPAAGPRVMRFRPMRDQIAIEGSSIRGLAVAQRQNATAHPWRFWKLLQQVSDLEIVVGIERRLGTSRGQLPQRTGSVF
jgi:hypothetical protein